MSFCSNYKFRQQIIDLLYTELFDNTFKSSKILEKWYDLIRENVDKDNTTWAGISNIIIPPKTKDALFECSKSNFGKSKRIVDLLKCNDFGHDTPIWLDSLCSSNNEEDTLLNNKRRIMFISQDPKRNNRVSGNLYISTPFGFHCKDYRTGKLMTNIIQGLFSNNKDICVYLTDFHKFYVNPSSSSLSINSPLICNNKKKFENVLKKEIELFNPDLIVTFGNETTKDFLSFYTNAFNLFDSLSILPVVHTSNQAGAISARSSYRTKLGYKNDADMYVDMILKNI